jgi:glycosyltransferase involved in cell wall biosynthesis
MEPKVTIAIPVCNEERYLERTLESVCAQTCGELAIIVSNNASTDGSRAMIESFARRDPRIIAHHHEQRINRNFDYLLAAAKTPYFMWLGGHDYLSPDFVERCLAALEENPAAMLATGRIFQQKEPGGEYLDNHEAFSTAALPTRMAVLSWLWGFWSCFQIYGVFKRQTLCEVEMVSFYGWDVAVLANLLMKGSAVFTHEPIYYATQTRPPETMKEQIRRVLEPDGHHDDLAYLKQPEAKMGRFFEPCKRHILAELWKTKLPLVEKVWTAMEIKRVFKERLDYVIP